MREEVLEASNTNIEDFVRILREHAHAMHMAPSNVLVITSNPDIFYNYNWKDKPHSVLYDATFFMRTSADTVERLNSENAELKKRLRTAISKLNSLSYDANVSVYDEFIQENAKYLNEGNE